MHKNISVLLLSTLCLLLSSSSFISAFKQTGGHSLRLHRQPHSFHLHSSYSSSHPLRSSRTGTSLPMQGGYLTLGAYYIKITVGSNSQPLVVLVDTGSSNTAVPLPSCGNSCGSGPFYQPNLSSSATNITCNSQICQKCNPDGSTTDCVFGPPLCTESDCGFAITYGGGSSALYGTYYQDLLCLGSLCGKAQIGGITGQYYFQSNFNSSTIFYGIIGFAYPMNACNPSCTTPIFDDLSNQNGLPNLIAMCITGSDGGVLDLGEIDNSRFVGELQYAPVITKRWYNIEIVDIQVGGISVGLQPFMFGTTNDVIGAFVDSGTSIILLAPVIFNQLQSIFQSTFEALPGVNGTSGFFPPGGINACISSAEMGNNLSKFPTLSWIISSGNGSNFTLTTSPEAYLIFSGGDYCLGIMSTIGIGVILGDVFMQSYYVVFDRVNDRLGFAPAVAANC